MKVRLVSHASVLIETGDCIIWTDPWLFGKAFNDSWSLFPPANFDNALLDRINYIWVSHEHPDHFHIPTLRSLPAAFKDRVMVLHQVLNTEKMVTAFHKLGFPHVQTLAHREIMQLTRKTQVYCYHVGIMDSCLAVRYGTHTLLNANDAQLGTSDCHRIGKDIGSVDVYLAQFSIAFYTGHPEYSERLRHSARGLVHRMYENQIALGARVTIPFASLIYYSSVENQYINQFHNTPRTVYEYFKERKREVVVLYPGDTYKVGAPYDSKCSLNQYDELYASLDHVPYDQSATVDLTQLKQAFAAFTRHLHEKNSGLVLRLLKPITVRIPDLNQTVVFSIHAASFDATDEPGEPDMIVSSQPLHFAFSNSYGFQTLGVTARYILLHDSLNWRLHRFLFSLDNAQIYLRLRYLLAPKTLNYFRSRSSGGFNLLTYVARRIWMNT